MSCQNRPLSGERDKIDLESMELERIPPGQLRLGIRLHLARLSLSNTTSEFEKFGVERSRKIVHDWVQKAEV